MTFPDVRELVPHSGSMLLLRRVLEHAPERTVCEVDPGDGVLFADDRGRVPSWLGLEYMAQCVAAHGGLHARAAADGPRQGMLLGTRRLRLEVVRFAAGRLLRVAATRAHAVGHATGRMLSFDCEIHDAVGETRLAAARLSVYVSEHMGTIPE